MININTEYLNEHCTGCGACLNSCPKDAIKMKESSDGFFYPTIDQSKCIRCKKCLNICPALNSINEVYPSAILVGYSKDNELRKNGSSGGLFPVLAKEVIDSNGIVFGAFFDYENKIVKHESNLNVDLKSIYKSKYVQSDTNTTFRKVKQYLDLGSKVLYSGTPCQIYGLYAYLGKEYSNLITVDFMCHGVPSPSIFKEMLQKYELKEKSKIVNCTFREKRFGWVNQHIILYFENGKSKSYKSKTHYFYNLFINNIILRKSCYKCKYNIGHKADITLADAWNHESDDQGISRIFINTKKGVEFLESIKNELIIEPDNKKYSEKVYEHNFLTKNRAIFFKFYKLGKNNVLLLLLFNIKCFIIRLKNKF